MNGKLSFDNFRFGSGESENLVFEETYDNTFTKISVDSDIYNINIIHRSDDKINVRIYSDNNKINEVKNLSNELNIKVREKNKIAIFNFIKPVIYIEVPSEFSGVVHDVPSVETDVYPL